MLQCKADNRLRDGNNWKEVRTMSTERIQEDRIGLIESYRNAETDEQKAEIRDRLMATLNDRERAFFMDAYSL